MHDATSQLAWLVQEAGTGSYSQWGLDELQHEDHPKDKAELRKQAFHFLSEYHRKGPEERERASREVESEIQGRLTC